MKIYQKIAKLKYIIHESSTYELVLLYNVLTLNHTATPRTYLMYGPK